MKIRWRTARICNCIERNRHGSLNDAIYHVKLGAYNEKE